MGLDLVRNVLDAGAKAASETPVHEAAADEDAVATPVDDAAATPLAAQAMSECETPETVTDTPAAEDPTQAKAVVIGWLPKDEIDAWIVELVEGRFF